MKIYDAYGKETGTINLPQQFKEEVRADLISRAVLAVQSNGRQKYGAFPEAGKRPSVRVSKRRRDYRTSYGIGMARTPQKVMSVRGSRFNWVGAFAPNTVKGRAAHPPKSLKDWTQKINKKENKKAIRSAISATLSPDIVKNRGHIVPKTYPFALDDSVINVSKTKEVIGILSNLGFAEELKRNDKRKIRAGKGKMRGRRYITKRTLLLVVGDKRCALAKAASNIAGMDVINAANLNAELLAPGCMHGRAALFTKEAIEKISKERLFM